MFVRANRTIELLRSLGIRIEHIVIPGREHNNKNGKGVNTAGDKIINDAYKESIKLTQDQNELTR